MQILRKNIKGINLKVYRNCTVKLSLPMYIPDEWVAKFLEKKKKWIDTQITKYKESSGINTLDAIKNGTSVQFLGKDMRVHIQKAEKDRITIEEKIILVGVKNGDIEKANKLFANWWKTEAAKIYEKEKGNLYHKIFAKYKIEEPKLYVKKMKTLWGSCTPNKCKITLNEYLVKANIRCIQYVILHELTHLLYPNHSKDFYNFLTIQMPDWQERKKELDKEVVQGLS